MEGGTIIHYTEVSAPPLDWAAHPSSTAEDAARRATLRVYQEHAPDLLLAAAAMGGEHTSADEALQESFFAYYSLLKNGAVVANPKAWILEDLRTRLRDSPGPNTGAGHFLDLPQEAIPLLDELLSKREADVVRLRNQGLKYNEIAATLGIAVGTVGTLLGRALRKLHVKLRAKQAR